MTLINKARIVHPIFPEGFLSHLLIDSNPPNLRMKYRNMLHSIRMTCINAHFPIIFPKSIATRLLIVIINGGDRITMYFCLYDVMFSLNLELIIISVDRKLLIHMFGRVLQLAGHRFSLKKYSGFNCVTQINNRKKISPVLQGIFEIV